jgi:hypothetical protein
MDGNHITAPMDTMLIRYGFRLSFEVFQPTPVVSRLDVHPDRRPDILEENGPWFGGYSAPPAELDVHGNLTRRLLAPPGVSVLELSGIATDPGLYEPQLGSEPLAPVNELPEEALLYMLPSRYCESDDLAAPAWRMFGHLPQDASRIRAVVDHVHHSLTFG